MTNSAKTERRLRKYRYNPKLSDASRIKKVRDSAFGSMQWIAWVIFICGMAGLSVTTIVLMLTTDCDYGSVIIYMTSIIIYMSFPAISLCSIHYGKYLANKYGTDGFSILGLLHTLPFEKKSSLKSDFISFWKSMLFLIATIIGMNLCVMFSDKNKNCSGAVALSTIIAVVYLLALFYAQFKISKPRTALVGLKTLQISVIVYMLASVFVQDSSCEALSKSFLADFAGAQAIALTIIAIVVICLAFKFCCSDKIGEEAWFGD